MTGDVKNRIPPPVRFTIADDTAVTEVVIDYFIKKNADNLARYRLLEDYYHNRTAIQSRTMSDGDKPNNRISHAFAQYISRISTAYFMGLGIRYEAKPRQYKKALDSIMSGELTQIQHFEEAKEMANCGISYELLFIDPAGALKSKFYKAAELIPIFSQTPGGFLSLAIRPYRVESIDKGQKAVDYADVYDKQYIYRYHKAGSGWVPDEKFSHNLSDVPVIIRCNNNELKGDYEDVIPQIDAYDKAQSDTSNDLDYFSDAYLNLQGIDSLQAIDDDGNELSAGESAKVMRQSRLLITPTGCKAEFVTKNVDDAQSEHHKDRLRNDIFFLSQVPNLTDESFAGNLSGVAIKYKLFGLEELVIEKETYFTSSELKKVRLVTRWFGRATREMDKRIVDFYKRYADKEQLTLPQAKAALTDRQALKLTLEETQALAQLYPEDKAIQQLLDKAYYARAISREDFLKWQLELLSSQLYGEYAGELHKTLTEVFEESYYKSRFDLQQFVGFGTAFNRISTHQIEAAVTTAWKGKNYSERLWGDHRMSLARYMNRIVTNGFIQGSSSGAMRAELQKAMSIGAYEARRLIRTESCQVSNRASLLAYQENGTNRFEFLATLDIKTSELCRDMDGRVFLVSDGKSGVNMPPLHPFCRSTTVPYLPNAELDGDDTRAARNATGEVYTVPADMTYRQWHDEYISSNPVQLLAEQKFKHGRADVAQYKDKLKAPNRGLLILP